MPIRSDHRIALLHRNPAAHARLKPFGIGILLERVSERHDRLAAAGRVAFSRLLKPPRASWAPIETERPQSFTPSPQFSK